MKLLYLVLVSINIAIGMKPFDFCKRTNEKCVGTYDRQNRYAEKCQLDKCPKQFKYYCSVLNVCGNSKLSCTQLNETKNFIEAIRIPYTHSHEMNKLKKYMSNFQECPLTQSYLNSVDICMNGRNCFYTKSSKNKSAIMSENKPVVCPCPSQNSFHCGDFYCATHSVACHLFISSKIEQKSFRKCLNDNTILKGK